MTAGWVIAVPAWGEHYRSLFLGPVLRSHLTAIDRLNCEFRNSVRVRYIVHTDAPAEVAAALQGFEVTLVPPPPPGAPYLAFAAAHRQAIETARDKERVGILNADMLVSIEAFAAAEHRFRQGKRAIIAAGTRTVAPTPHWWRRNFGPSPMPARQLLAWSMRNAHPITKQCFWGPGRCHLPWGIYFREGGNVVLRAFHLHPFAVVKDRDLPFQNTVDLAMVDNYRRDEMHIVTDADEMALAEMSPLSKTFDDNAWPIDTTAILTWALRGAGPTHWWNFGHRICIQGDPAAVTSDAAVADTIARLDPYKEAA